MTEIKSIAAATTTEATISVLRESVGALGFGSEVDVVTDERHVAVFGTVTLVEDGSRVTLCLCITENIFSCLRGLNLSAMVVDEAGIQASEYATLDDCHWEDLEDGSSSDLVAGVLRALGHAAVKASCLC